MQQKIKQDESRNIGKNIREIRIAKGIGQTELVRLLDLRGIPITRAREWFRLIETTVWEVCPVNPTVKSKGVSQYMGR